MHGLLDEVMSLERLSGGHVTSVEQVNPTEISVINMTAITSK